MYVKQFKLLVITLITLVDTKYELDLSRNSSNKKPFFFQRSSYRSSIVLKLTVNKTIIGNQNLYFLSLYN